MTSHAEYIVAIDKALERLSGYAEEAHRRQRVERDLLDLCLDILDLHQPRSGKWDPVTCVECTVSGADTTVYRSWPCPTVQVVADALTRMGALPTVVDVTHDMQIDDPLDDDYEPAIDVDGYPT